jgi:GntR family transcriptional regulator, transcriptional repressor for pyruvate dehydrogenase complex
MKHGSGNTGMNLVNGLDLYLYASGHSEVHLVLKQSNGILVIPSLSRSFSDTLRFQHAIMLRDWISRLKPEQSMTLHHGTPIERTTLAAAAFEQLISNVVHGNWKAGDLIPPERELCQQLGIARTSLREALKAMELIGMLESRVGFGTMICPRSEFLSRPLLWAFTGTDHTELSEILEARALLERDLAGLAAERASSEELAAIEEAIELMAQKIKSGESVLDADMAFHLAISRAAHNEVLGNAAQLLRNLMKYWLDLKLRLPNVPKSAMQLHRTIYQAIRDRNADAARKFMWEHLHETSALVTQVVAGYTKPPRTVSKKVFTANRNGAKPQGRPVKKAIRIK